MSYIINIILDDGNLSSFEEQLNKDINIDIEENIVITNPSTNQKVSINGQFLKIIDREITLEKYKEQYRFNYTNTENLNYVKELFNKYKLDYKLIGVEGEEI